MPLHVPTLAIMVVMVTMMTGALLFISWLQNRDVKSLLWWSAANIIAGSSLPLLGLRGRAPDFVTIDLANAILTVGFACMWAGFRAFGGKPLSRIGLIAPALVWLALCRVDMFYHSVEARVIVCSAIVVGYTLASVWELSRLGNERLVSRYPAIAWLCVHALFFGMRIPLALIAPVPPTEAIVDSPWFGILNFEALLNTVAMAFLQIAMIRERAENRFRVAALTDALTGAPNRRALLDDAGDMLQRTVARGQSVCLLLIDIDHFKSINDRFGHEGGDMALVGVARTMRGHLRPDDLFGRLGGEEFVCVLPDTPLGAALAVAEGLRARVAGLNMASAAGAIRVSVSIGVASSADGAADVAALLREADRNLYEAKASGRNRIGAPKPSESQQRRLRLA